MGDRAIIILTDGQNVSPSIYLHWGGEAVPTLLEGLRERMKGREGDLDYSAARLVGLAHEMIDGNLSLGLWNTDLDDASAVIHERADELKALSPGDAGLIVARVDREYQWRAFSGYLAEREAA